MHNIITQFSASISGHPHKNALIILLYFTSPRINFSQSSHIRGLFRAAGMRMPFTHLRFKPKVNRTYLRRREVTSNTITSIYECKETLLVVYVLDTDGIDSFCINVRNIFLPTFKMLLVKWGKKNQQFYFHCHQFFSSPSDIRFHAL